MPPALLLRRSTHRLRAAFKLRALEKTLSLHVALEEKPLLNVALSLLLGQSSSDGAKVNLVSV
jgi:hypothetical protein